MLLTAGTRLGHSVIEASVSMFALSRDDRTIIYGGQRAESDIWTMETR
jgi:hypothetical protein